MAHSNDEITRIVKRIKEFDTGAHKKWSKKLSFLRPPTRPAIERVSTKAARFESYTHRKWNRRPEVSDRVASIIAKQKKRSQKRRNLLKTAVGSAAKGFTKALKKKD